MHRARMMSILMGLSLVIAVASPASAELKLAGVFGDHAVLQRELPIPVWGWADAGDKITVRLGDQAKTATADSSGKWSVRLDALKAGGPYTLTVQGRSTIQVQDVLVGEVWLCSGQSNMAMSVNGVLNATDEIAKADYPQIRMCRISSKTAETPQTDCQGAWQPCTPKTVGSFSATAFFFGRPLHRDLKVPVGLINSSWGGTPIEGWTSLEVQEKLKEMAPAIEAFKKSLETYDPKRAEQQHEKALAAWKLAAAKAKAAGQRVPRQPSLANPHLSPSSPGRIYNAMIAPLAPYGLRGAIWYQGESNASRAATYGLQLQAMIANWRADWGQGDFPFLTVQLPNYHQQQTAPAENSSWSLVREGMLKTLKETPNAGMAVTIDVGDANNIHPTNKQEVGRRLACWALSQVYKQPTVASGPIYSSMEKQGDKIAISFSCYGSKLAVKDGGKLQGFAVAGADKKFVWADATIEGDRVLVSSREVKDPVAVRYGWSDNPTCNLFNEAGLPASPFRTDDWKE